ncbi:hypothetical protein BGX24_007014 [Mortierella sp. AD032]|nr:hypothetical protein BGX24_007014 [Mortierella sp. AD032]
MDHGMVIHRSHGNHESVSVNTNANVDTFNIITTVTTMTDASTTSAGLNKTFRKARMAAAAARRVMHKSLLPSSTGTPHRNNHHNSSSNINNNINDNNTHTITILDRIGHQDPCLRPRVMIIVGADSRLGSQEEKEEGLRLMGQRMGGDFLAAAAVVDNSGLNEM